MHILRGACIPIPILRYLARKGISGGTWRNCCSGDLALMGHDDGFACGFLDPLAVCTMCSGEHYAYPAAAYRRVQLVVDKLTRAAYSR